MEKLVKESKKEVSKLWKICVQVPGSRSEHGTLEVLRSSIDWSVKSKSRMAGAEAGKVSSGTIMGKPAL